VISADTTQFLGTPDLLPLASTPADYGNTIKYKPEVETTPNRKY